MSTTHYLTSSDAGFVSVSGGSATVNAVPRYDSTTGLILADSLLIVDNAGDTQTPGDISGGSLSTTGAVSAGSVDATGDVFGTSLTTTGAVSADSVTATGTVTGGSLSTAGAVNADSVTATGTVTGGSLSTTGAVSADSVSATNDVSGGSLSTLGAVSAGSVSSTGVVTGGSLSTAGAVSADSVTATGTVTGGSLSTTGVVSGASLTTTGNVSVGTSLTFDDVHFISTYTELSGTFNVWNLGASAYNFGFRGEFRLEQLGNTMTLHANVLPRGGATRNYGDNVLGVNTLTFNRRTIPSEPYGPAPFLSASERPTKTTWAYSSFITNTNQVSGRIRVETNGYIYVYPDGGFANTADNEVLHFTASWTTDTVG